MIYLKWLIMVPVMLVVTVLTFPLAFILPRFAELREGPLNNGTRNRYTATYAFSPRISTWKD